MLTDIVGFSKFFIKDKNDERILVIHIQTNLCYPSSCADRNDIKQFISSNLTTCKYRTPSKCREDTHRDV